jgi:UDP-glucose 4-epimerase
MNAVLVTGGAGYVGAHASRALRRAGSIPAELDNPSTGHKNFVKWGPIIHADIKDTEAVRQVRRTCQVELWSISPRRSMSQKYYGNNVVGVACAAQCHAAGRLQHLCCEQRSKIPSILTAPQIS